MSEAPGETRQEEGVLPAPPAESGAHAGAARGVAAALAAVLILVVAAVAAAPFWAPAVIGLLPWGARSAVSQADHAALAARVADIEKRPVPPTVDVGAIKSAESALGQRLDRLEAAGASAASMKAGLQQLDQRVGAIEAQAVGEAAARDKMQQELSRLGGVAAGLSDRLAAVEHQLSEEKGADRSDAALLLALMQMREAVEAARPFPAEYDTFTALAREHPELASAAAPLAEAARAGVAGRAVLKERLTDLAPRIAAAAEPEPDGDWWDQALARLRGLVTIRRIGSAAQTGPEAAVGVAELALARGDLSAAVTALGALDGAGRAAAEPWLRMARDRLAVEGTLAHLQEMLVARLGGAPSPAPAKPESPR